MGEARYSNVPAKIPELFKALKSKRVPQQVDKAFFDKLGFTTTADKTLSKVLSILGFVDEAGLPTNRWNEYRNDSTTKKALSEGIREGYADIFEFDENAATLGEEDLTNYFRSTTGKGERTVGFMVNTFTVLCEMAGLREPDEAKVIKEKKPKIPAKRKPITKIEKEPDKEIRVSKSRPEGIQININIQLQLPDEKDPEVYEAFFAALKKHLID